MLLHEVTRGSNRATWELAAEIRGLLVHGLSRLIQSVSHAANRRKPLGPELVAKVPDVDVNDV